MQVAVDLVANRSKNRFGSMTSIHAPDSACEVKKDVAINVFHQCAFRPGGEHWSGMEHTSRDSPHTPLHQFLRARTWNRCS
jgi:hypothetical protein